MEKKRMVDDPQCKRPSIAVTVVTIGKTEQLLKEYRRLLLGELSDSLCVSLKRVHHVITVEWA
jgi:hypothetical protein